MTNNTPVAKLRDGAIQASIFENANGDNGSFFSVQVSRTYQDANGEYQNANSFSGTELLKLSRLSQKAYDAILDLRQAARASAEQAA